MANMRFHRAVTSIELSEIVAEGEYRLRKGAVEGKYFFESSADAVRFARKMFQLFPDEGPYTITSAMAPALVMKSSVKLVVVYEGMVWFVPENVLPLGPVTIWAYCPYGESL